MFTRMKCTTKRNPLFFCLILALITSLCGCKETLNILKLDTNRLINVSIPKGVGYVDVDFTVPQDAYDSVLSFSIESKNTELSIVLTDPNDQIVSSDKSPGSFQLFPTSKVGNSKWTFDKVTSPMPGEWTFRIATSNGDKLGENVLVKVSIGLFEKYTAFVKPLETKGEVSQPFLVQLRLSEYGVPSNIEGHPIQVINRNSETVDTIYVSKRVTSLNGSLISPSPSDYYAQFTAKEAGEYTFVAEFKLQQRNNTFKKRVYSNQAIVVTEPSVNLTSIDFLFNEDESSNPSLIAIANVSANRSIWLILRLSFTLGGETFEVSRNIKLSSQQSAQLNYSFESIDYKNTIEKKLVLNRIDLIDFDTNSNASLLRSYAPNLLINKQVSFSPPKVE